MNKEKTIYQCYEEIKQREVAELKEALKPHGNYVCFSDDEDVVIMVNYNEPCDVKVIEVANANNELKIIVRGYYDDADWICPIEDIAYGHIEFITNAVKNH